MCNQLSHLYAPNNDGHEHDMLHIYSGATHTVLQSDFTYLLLLIYPVCQDSNLRGSRLYKLTIIKLKWCYKFKIKWGRFMDFERKERDFKSIKNKEKLKICYLMFTILRKWNVHISIVSVIYKCIVSLYTHTHIQLYKDKHIMYTEVYMQGSMLTYKLTLWIISIINLNKILYIKLIHSFKTSFHLSQFSDSLYFSISLYISVCMCMYIYVKIYV